MNTNHALAVIVLLDRMTPDDMRDLEDDELAKLRRLAQLWRDRVAAEMCQRCGNVF